MSASQAATQRHILRNAAVVGASFAVAMAMGVIRNMIIAYQFGVGADLDAYYAAFKLPDLLFTIVAGGALATAFIPVFADFESVDDRVGAWRLTSAVTNWVVLITAGLAALAALAAPWLVRTLIAPGFTATQQAETVTVMRIVLLSTIIFGISAVQASALHGFKHFLLPALAAAAYPLGIIGGALWLAPTYGVAGLAMGAVIGSLLHLAIKIPALLYYGFQWRPVLSAPAHAVRRVAILMGPRVLDLALFQITLLATTNLASRLAAGSVSAVEWGWDAMQLPETIIGTAFGVVAFPTLAELAALNDRDGLRHALSESLRTVLTLAVPAAFGLILLGRPLIQTLYQRGAFDSQATDAVYVALRFFALGLVGHCCLELAARTFFAQKDTVTPLLVAAGSAGLNIALGVALMKPLAHGGLALANSIAVTAEVGVLLALLSRQLGGIEGRETLGVLVRVTAASVVMAVVIGATQQVAGRAGAGELMAALLAAAAGAGVYFVVSFLLGVTELRDFVVALVPARR